MKSQGFCFKLSAVVVTLSWVLAIWAYDHLPSMVASHWDQAGNVNGQVGRFWGAVLFPLILTILLGLFWALPKIDPKAKNIAAFRDHFDRFILVLVLILVYIYSLTLYWNIIGPINFARWLVLIFVPLDWSIAELLKVARPNWTIGIRTPWTLSNEDVWYRTQALGARLFRVAAIASIVGFVWPTIGYWLVLAAILLAALIPTAYSAVIFRHNG